MQDSPTSPSPRPATPALSELRTPDFGSAPAVSISDDAARQMQVDSDLQNTPTQYQFGTAGASSALFEPAAGYWVPRFPVAPLVVHAPGTCAVCEAYLAHLPRSGGDLGFDQVVESL